MAGSTVTITFKLDGDAKGFQDLAKSADGLKKSMEGALKQAQQLKGSVINFAALATGIDAAQRSFQQLHQTIKGLATAYAVQETAERKLETIMAQRMGATQAEVQSIKDLASAQQELGVVGDEVQLSGAQQLATFLDQKASLETLIPAMNNLIAQQKGLEATTSDAVGVGNLMGKVMQGQVAALTKVGVTFSEAEEKVLKFGTEQERAAVLAQVITNNVGNMNAELAKTESGKQKQLENTLGDIQEQLGGLVNGALPFVTIAAHAATTTASLITLVSGINSMKAALIGGTKAFAVSTIAFVKNKAAIIGVAVAQKAVQIATVAWTTVQKILNAVLTANPIGLLITAIGALVAGAIYAYKNFEGFRSVVNSLWSAIKPLADLIMSKLSSALSWVADKAKQAWEWLKRLLGLGGSTAEVTVDVKTNDKGESSVSNLLDKYKNYKDPSKTSKKSKEEKPRWKEGAESLKDITGNIQILNDKLQKASINEAELINKQIEAWEKKAKAIREVGKTKEKDDPIWSSEAQTLKEITDNINILNDQLQKATKIEAVEINKQIEAWEKKAEAIKTAGKEVSKIGTINEGASTLKEISKNIEVLNESLQTASINEASMINQQIAAWEKKAEAIKNAGKEVQKTSISSEEALNKSWGGIKGMGDSIERITDAVEGNGSAWQVLTTVVDGFLSLYQGFKTVLEIMKLLTGASTALTIAKTAEVGAEVGATAARATSAATSVGVSAGVIAANKLESASFKELAAAKYMAAHASIPFAGFGIGAGFTAAMLASVTAAGIPALASGGVATGPTLALVGEYAGASSNPEVIAPLDKLRSMISDAPQSLDGRVTFEIKGRSLVGILSKENNLKSRS